MKDGRRTTSIARRIAWDQQWKGLVRILWQTVLLAAAAVVSWCAAMMQMVQGSFLNAGSARLVTGGQGFYLTRQIILDQMSGGHIVDRSVALELAGGRLIYMGEFLFWLSLVLGALVTLRLILWFFACFRSAARVRRYLRPIDDIAQVTESISSRGFDESKFHSLQEAIDHLNGASADEQLQIGDDDLAGLETAVNNLIVRMHNGYRQQVRFVDDASHELRTPIAVIQGYVDMLDRWGKTDEQVLDESIRAIKTETAHMKTLVDQLLFLARGDAGRQELDMKAMDMAALMREVWEESRMIDADHEYIIQAEEPVFAMADEALLKQAVRILTDNAAKYSPARSRITLRVYAENGSVCLDVQDNGMGVSQADAGRMFDRFYRADAARNSETGGSGLGLSIAKWIVGRHNGYFRVASYEDIGTRMTIVLPGLTALPEIGENAPG